MVSSTVFTPFDKIVMNIILSFINEFQILQQLSLKYRFHVTRNNIFMQNESDKYINVTNIDLNQIFEVESFPYGKLVDTTFTWHTEWIRNGVKNRIDEICDSYCLSDEVRNTFSKFISSKYITFDDNYKDVIPIFLALISESSKYNLITFYPEDNSPNYNWKVYHIIHVPLSVLENVTTKINTIFDQLHNY
jgi:hypothetical protein